MLNFNWLSGVSHETARMVFFGLFIFIGMLILLISNAYAFKGIETERWHWWNNLKLWGLVVLGMLFTVYYIF